VEEVRFPTGGEKTLDPMQLYQFLKKEKRVRLNVKGDEEKYNEWQKRERKRGAVPQGQPEP